MTGKKDQALAIQLHRTALLQDRRCRSSIRLLATEPRNDPGAPSNTLSGIRAGEPYASSAFAAAMKARTFAGSFTPGLFSTPDETSTAGAPDFAIASATFSAVSPIDM